MNEYKLVPVKPTPEMVSKGARLLQIMSLPEREAASVFRAMLAAAPDIQREPVAKPFAWAAVSPCGEMSEMQSTEQCARDLANDWNKELHTLHSGPACHVQPLYAAPTREEQKEPDSLCVEDDGCPTEKAVLQRFWRKHHQTAPDVAKPKSPTPKESWRAGYRAGKGLPANTPRQDAIAAPDMPVLTEALRQYRNNDGSKLVFGYDKLLVDRHVAGLVEALEAVMEFGCDPKSNRGKWAQEKAESVLAAYHKGDES